MDRYFRFALAAIFASMLGVSQPSNAGDVYFTQFDVSDCNEVGTCDWRLNCWVGRQQNGQTFFTMREANSGESLEINRNIEFEKLPITVGCRAEEYDGGIGATWENLGVQNLTIEHDGPYTLGLEDNEDEGVVTVQFVVSSTGSGSQEIVEAPAERSFLGVFRAGQDAHYLIAGVDGAKFNSEWSRLSKAGFRLTDLNTYVDGGKRLYTGIYRQGNDGYALLPGMSWTDFSTGWQRASGEGMRLVDIETYTEGNQRRYSGVFRAGSGGHYLTPALSWGDFTSKWEQLAGQGLRLIDIESYVAGGKRYFHGAFLPGTDGHYLWRATGWKAFVDKWTSLSKQNLRLIDVEVYGSGSNRTYVGVYRAGSDGYALYAAKGEDFFKKWDTLSKQGLRLIDLETYTD
jgi:Bacterial tandem repeat domain 1